VNNASVSAARIPEIKASSAGKITSLSRLELKLLLSSLWQKYADELKFIQ